MLIRTDNTVKATITSAKYVGTFIARLIASAPTYIEAKNIPQYIIPIGLRPASIATAIPAYPKPGERSKVK